MKKWIIFGIAIFWVLTAKADLIITEVMSSSSHTNSLANGDWWELYNSGAIAIDLTYYSWDDSSGSVTSAFFNGVTIDAGQAIIISQETVGQEQAWKDLWGLGSVTVVNLGNTEFQNFSSSGDQVNVYDPSSNLIASVTFGVATMGFTFAWDSAGNSLGVSVNGENGAFQASSPDLGGGPDVGSPGFVIPEPGTLALLGVSGLILLGRRFFHG